MTCFRTSRLLLALLAAGSAITVVRAQETRATLSGAITDPSGAAVTGAHISVINVDTAARFTAESNALGLYRILFLNPGKYRLTVEMSGFRTLVREGIELSTNQAATLDVALQIGTQAETVTVGAEAPLLEAEKADRGRRRADPQSCGAADHHAHADPAGDSLARGHRHQSALRSDAVFQFRPHHLVDQRQHLAQHRIPAGWRSQQRRLSVVAQRRVHSSGGRRAGVEGHRRRLRRAVRTQWRRCHQHGHQERDQRVSRLRVRLPETAVV